VSARLTKQEVAEALNVTARSVERRSSEFVTTPAEQKSANGRAPRMYDLASLPPDAALRWAEQTRRKVVDIQSSPGQLALALTLPQGPNLSEADRAEAERRLTVIEPLVSPARYEALWAECGRRAGKMVDLLAHQHGTKPRTIYHWLKAYKSAGLPGLVNKDRRDKGIPRVLSAAALDFLLAAALPRQGAYGELSVAEIHRAYGEERDWRAAHIGKHLGDFELRKYSRYLDGNGCLAQTALLPAVSYETLRTWYDRLPEAIRVMAREGREVFANTQEIISFRNLSDVQPLDYVVMDHRRLDLFCLIPQRGSYTLSRPWLTAAIDMRTRKWLAWAIVETPSSESIAVVLKRAFLDHGLPAGLYWDNGKDFTCEWFEGRRSRTRQAGRIAEMPTAWRGVLDMLGVRVHHAIVRRARSKIIEPNFVRTALYDKSTDWWCGHKPTARPERFATLIEQHEQWLRGQRTKPAFPTIDEIATLYSELMKTLNERALEGEGMRKVTPTGHGWMCPNECWESLIGRVERKTVPAEVLQFCFAKRRTITVRNAEVQTSFGGRQYHYRLSDPRTLMGYNGREIEFAYDPADLETVALYCDARFLGLANNVELRRMGEDAFVEDERDRRRQRREISRFITAVHSAIPVPGVVERSARRAEVRPARIEPQRQEVAAEVPAALVEAAQAKADGQRFSFANANTDAVQVSPSAARSGDGEPDDEFEFFQGDTNGKAAI
jgi:hypothetical protein